VSLACKLGQFESSGLNGSNTLG
jgi:hypothetical protein